MGLGFVQSLDVLTINEGFRSEGDLVEIVWRAFDYFPRGIWEGVNFVGNVSVGCDLEIKSGEGVYGAFVFSRLIGRIREMRRMFRVEDLLLAVTHDPVVVTFHRFDVDRFKRIVNVVHDYVSDDVGVISLFKTEEDAATKIAAHGLGHNRGLTHHGEPVDLMYARLLNGNPIRIDGFCKECKEKLRRRKSV